MGCWFDWAIWLAGRKQVLVGLMLLPTWAATAGDSSPPFSLQTQLGRFDRDESGHLDEPEAAAVRAAFRGIDVPSLPAPPHRYALSALPPHWARGASQDWDSSPTSNPLSDRGATLGRVLFYDKHLSRNNTIACASCHHQRLGFADPERFSLGHAGGRTKRNAMGLANLRFTRLRGHPPGLFWDERAESLEDQALMPIQDPVEMAMELDQLEAKLQQLPYYPALFQWVFASPEVTREKIAQALAQFVRAIVSVGSRFDQAAAKAKSFEEDFDDFTNEENLGKQIFMVGLDGIAEFSCALCHQPPTFNMPLSMNIGLERNYQDGGLGDLKRPSNDPFSPSNDGKFRAPSLKNIALTAPYMHDGRFASLDEVLEHYSTGVVADHPNLSLGIRTVDENGRAGFHFTTREKAALIAFLKTLTDQELLDDPRFKDPFLRPPP